MGNLKTPTAVIFYVTNKCNLRCCHCFYWDSLNKNTYELGLDAITKIVGSFESPLSLSFTGGEPFLRKDFSDIVDIFVKNGKAKEIAIATNGFLVEKIIEFCERFLKEYPTIPLSFQVSLDGLEETHDSIRMVTGSFKRAIKTLDKLVDISNRFQQLSVGAGIAVQKKNVDEIEGLIDLIGNGAIQVRINLIRGESSGTFGVKQSDSSHNDPKEGGSIALNVEEMHRLYDILCRKNEKHDFWTKRHKRIFEIGMEVLEKKKKVVDCYAGTIDAVIYANGDVAFCELTKEIGNLLDYKCDMLKLWNSAEAISMRPKVKNCFCTHGCNISTSLMFDPEFVKEALSLS
ncbi:MAG: radical SAM protein [Chlorobi bacterium]|nr:radical SAM protein [Chlorobiota bacterium]